MIKAREYTDLQSFTDACVRAVTAKLPGVTDYDDYSTAGAKRSALYIAAVKAEEDAREVWEAYIEHMEELYERGVGPAWA